MPLHVGPRSISERSVVAGEVEIVAAPGHGMVVPDRMKSSSNTT